jgi:hypothetical protein
LCIKKPGRKQKDPPTVHLIGELSEYISEQPRVAKYGNPGNPVVTITINEVPIGNTLIDLGAAINVMTVTTLEELQLKPLLRPTPTILELADKTKVIPEGILDDIIVTFSLMGVPSRLSCHSFKGSYQRTSRYFGKTLVGHNQCIYWL